MEASYHAVLTRSRCRPNHRMLGMPFVKFPNAHGLNAQHAEYNDECTIGLNEERQVKKLSLFMNWFNGICAPVCGIWMMLSALFSLPLSWNDWMPLSIYDPFPLHDVFFTSHFWPGLALFLVNGVPNIVALVLRQNSDTAWHRACLVAGILLLCWTITEMLFIPNGLSLFYFVLGALQAVAAIILIRREAQA